MLAAILLNPVVEAPPPPPPSSGSGRRRIDPSIYALPKPDYAREARQDLESHVRILLRWARELLTQAQTEARENLEMLETELRESREALDFLGDMYRGQGVFVDEMILAGERFAYHSGMVRQARVAVVGALTDKNDLVGRVERLLTAIVAGEDIGMLSGLAGSLEAEIQRKRDDVRHSVY